ncbi:hypothetical protein FE697_021100 [Mumia zhuanghuii]|uniref:DUF5666 domain-containing protein n=2 Tax=Mumia TaxID=1546255 RepID=A0ABW1QL98_9ACTN|nr:MULTISPECIES: hypothetical protein [Mumia]KAA1418321.1 hypothetical protein FE697_021100 [Mumia zhuanghuii]
MTTSRALASAAAVLVLLATAACGDDDPDDDDTPTPAATTDAPSEATPTTGATSGSDDDRMEFELDTADDSVDVDGAATACDNPDEGTLNVTFADDGATVVVAVSGGTGSVTVSGSTEFEGRITSMIIGDDGSVNASGEGTLADDTAQPTTFTLEGRC